MHCLVAIHRSPKGILWFGDPNSLVMFDPVASHDPIIIIDEVISFQA